MKANNENNISAARIVWGYVGFCMMLVGTALFVPLLVILRYPEEIIFAPHFIVSAVFTILMGALLFRPIYKKKNVELDKKYDYFIVVLVWITAILICACPFLLTGEYSFTESIFEATSGLTTTGLTVMDVDHLPHIFLLFRSVMLYVGGIGIILIMTSLFATTFGMRLYNAEGHPNKLIPNVIKSARMIVCIYTGYILMGVILYILCGMPTFDAINHSIAAVANGGFSTRSQSIGYYHSVPIEIVTMVLMILGGTNFLLNLFLLKGNWKRFYNHCEVKVSIIAWVILVPILACVLIGGMCETFGEGFRVALFHSVSAMATAGFQTVESFQNFPSSGLLILSLLMIIGFQSGSTAGGIKEYRLAIIVKSIYYDLKTKLSGKRMIIPKKINMYGEDIELTSERTFEAHNFAMLYLSVITLGTLIYTLCGYSIEKSLFEFSSILACVGLSAGITGASANPFVNWVAIIGMIIGRLDFYPMIFVMIFSAKDAIKGMKRVVKKGVEE